MTSFEHRDVQGLVVSGYATMHESRYLLARVLDADAARRWVTEAAERVTVSDGRSERSCLNVAFTSSGLAALGVTDAELATFSVPFREGMTAPHRQRILGDVGDSAPTAWDWGGSGSEVAGSSSSDDVHVLVLLFAPDGDAMAEVEGAETDRLVGHGGFEIVRRFTPEPLPGSMRLGKFGVEHFGFADGMSQPVIEGTGQDDRIAGAERRRSVVATGEFVLGYPNGYGELTPWPRLTGAQGAAGDRFGCNGTYLVVRQLAQDVAGFWQYLRDQARPAPGQSPEEAVVRLGAALVGRWPSGAPLVSTHHRDDPDLAMDNAFGFASMDPHGERCPLGAHVRRANPRDSLVPDPEESQTLANLHRIVRRGRVYGPGLDDVEVDDGRERGLFFICLNANIERQFEFIQHTWLNNPKFGGGNDERDPLLGNPEGGGSFTVQGVPFRRRLHGLPSFVTVRGGGYFFLPGARALHALGTRHG